LPGPAGPVLYSQSQDLVADGVFGCFRIPERNQGNLPLRQEDRCLIGENNPFIGENTFVGDRFDKNSLRAEENMFTGSKF
jgi:hypothetical protein